MYKPEIKQSAIVHHPRFGSGRVIARYGEDTNSKVIVRFQEEGEKKLAIQYANLEADAPEVEPEAAEDDIAARLALPALTGLTLDDPGFVSAKADDDDEDEADEDDDDEDEE